MFFYMSPNSRMYVLQTRHEHLGSFHSTKHCLIKMLEKWKHLLDNGCNIGVVSMDLSKAIDVLNHFLLLANLDAYGFSLKSTSFTQSYLKYQ